MMIYWNISTTNKIEQIATHYADQEQEVLHQIFSFDKRPFALRKDAYQMEIFEIGACQLKMRLDYVNVIELTIWL